MLRQNYITRLWRDTAVRHGFEEINGPTFEMLELYTRKSGEGIVSELFRFRREGGEDDYALRPEFTPTLARMYAAKAASLPSPTKWFSIGPYFRAEKPQRGRLREFLQWNVDLLGTLPECRTDEDVASGASYADMEAMACLVGALEFAGLTPQEARMHFGSRQLLNSRLEASGVSDANKPKVLALIDSLSKMSDADVKTELHGLGLTPQQFEKLFEQPATAILMDSGSSDAMEPALVLGDVMLSIEWMCYDLSIVRGLAYYTGTVFEVIAEGERAIAGGGRYDNLIELFGGPPTPAVGFGMGDVVLGLLLDDKGLMPQGADLLDALSRPGASLRPEAFVVAGSEDEDALVEPLLANLRRGIERDGFDGRPWAADRYTVRPMHARRTYKTTRNLKKLLADAEKQHARFAIVLHGPDKVQVKDLDTREELVHDRGDFSVDPYSDAYVGKAIAQRLA
jgi:histidyl-tRNA synthetase